MAGRIVFEFVVDTEQTEQRMHQPIAETF